MFQSEFQLKGCYGSIVQRLLILLSSILILSNASGALESLQPGLEGEYFRLAEPADGFPTIPEGQIPALKRLDKSINFADTIDYFPGTEFKELFFVRWTGKVLILEAGNYTFHLEANDCARLFINEKLIVTSLNKSTADEVDLLEGNHDIRVEYFENTGTAGCRLYWESEEILKQIVPRRSLFHAQFDEKEELIIVGPESALGDFASPEPAIMEKNRQSFRKRGLDGIMKIIVAGETLEYPSWLGTLPLSLCRQTDGVSTLAWQSTLAPRVIDPDSFYEFRLPAAMGSLPSRAGGFQFSVNGIKMFDFDVTLDSKQWQSPGSDIRVSYTVQQRKVGWDSNGELLIDVKGSLLTPGEPVSFEVTGSATESYRWFGIYQLPDVSTPK